MIICSDPQIVYSALLCRCFRFASSENQGIKTHVHRTNVNQRSLSSHHHYSYLFKYQNAFPISHFYCRMHGIHVFTHRMQLSLSPGSHVLDHVLIVIIACMFKIVFV